MKIEELIAWLKFCKGNCHCGDYDLPKGFQCSACDRLDVLFTISEEYKKAIEALKILFCHYEYSHEDIVEALQATKEALSTAKELGVL